MAIVYIIIILLVIIAAVYWYFNRSAPYKPNPSFQSYEAGEIKRAQGDFAGSLPHFNDTLREKSTYASGYASRGIVHLELSKFDEAINDLTKAIELKAPDYTTLYFFRAQAYAMKQKFADAKADLDYLIERKPNVSIFYIRRSWICFSLGDRSSALDNLNHAAEIDPQNENIYSNRGWLHYKANDLDLALADYDFAIKLNPIMTSAFNNRACVYLLKDRLELAFSDANQAIKLQPDFYYAYGTRGQLHFVEQQYQDALADFQKETELEPANAYAIAGQALSYFRIGDLEHAKALWASAITKDDVFRKASTFQEHYNCSEPFAEAARQLIEIMSPPKSDDHD